MATESFIRYVVRGPSLYWWIQPPVKHFLKRLGWAVIAPAAFSYEKSYGFDPRVERNKKEIRSLEHSLHNATALVEYQGEPPYASGFFDTVADTTLIDDLLAFMSLYLGVYCQYLWKEHRSSGGDFKASSTVQINYSKNNAIWAVSRRDARGFFENALVKIPTLNKTQFVLAIRWFFSALREREVGRPLVEAALNWVCLESQSNCLGLSGNKFQKVKKFLVTQGFPPIPSIPCLHNFYQLRNDAFHEGQLSNLTETDAQAARTKGRELVRAQILNLLGMDHTDFDVEFVKLYAC